MNICRKSFCTTNFCASQCKCLYRKNCFLKLTRHSIKKLTLLFIIIEELAFTAMYRCLCSNWMLDGISDILGINTVSTFAFLVRSDIYYALPQNLKMNSCPYLIIEGYLLPEINNFFIRTVVWPSLAHLTSKSFLQK